MPIIFGVLTTDTVAQAVERADPEKFNRGGDAAKSAIEMATVMRMIRGAGDPALELESVKGNGRKARATRRRAK